VPVSSNETALKYKRKLGELVDTNAKRANSFQNKFPNTES